LFAEVAEPQLWLETLAVAPAMLPSLVTVGERAEADEQAADRWR
jgi:hypothetical protein